MKNNRLSFLSVLTALCALPCVSDAAIRIGAPDSNSPTARANRAGAYYEAHVYNQQTQQQNAIDEQTVASVDLPIPVENEKLAQQIIDGVEGAPTIEMLEKCSLLYPGGNFEWARPTVGQRAGGAPTCVAVIELRDQKKPDTTTNQAHTVVARARLAAGDTIECNASSFPENSYMPNLGEIIVPPDSPPTVEDVIAVMNEEQKQNAAIKIIGAAVIGGIGGNFIGKNEPGSDSMLGGGKDKIKSTVVGAAGSAALMTASTYSGKVAGDMILSAGVNAAAGAAIGNMVANGKSVLQIERCTVDGAEQTCLWGYYEETEAETGTTDNKNKSGFTYYVSKSGGSKFIECYQTGNSKTVCESVKIKKESIVIKQYTNKKNTSTGKNMDFDDIVIDKFKEIKDNELYCYTNGKMEQNTTDAQCSENNIYVKLENATRVSKRIPAMLVGVKDSAFGYKKDDWKTKVKPQYSSNQIVGRTGSGEATKLTLSNEDDKPNIDNFYPVYRDADDGGIIDMDNKARLGGTLTGAGVGAGMGALTAYQGAQAEIDTRWATAVQEYKDSLQKVYCGSGTRFISFYNDIAMVPELH